MPNSEIPVAIRRLRELDSAAREERNSSSARRNRHLDFALALFGASGGLLACTEALWEIHRMKSCDCGQGGFCEHCLADKALVQFAEAVK